MPTEIMRLIYILAKITWIFWQMANGKEYLQKSRKYLQRKKREHGLIKMALGSDAFFPFGDNIERAYKSGVKYIAQPGGSIRDDNVIEACNKHNIAMCFTGMRLFHH